MKSTYKDVLAFSEETLFQETELFPSLYGEGNVLSGVLIFVIAARTTAEGKRILLGLKNHLKPMLSISLNMPVRIWIKSPLRSS